MARVLHFDCFSGAAGDMVLSALLDAGLPLADLRSALGSLGVDHQLEVQRVVRAGVSATHLTVKEIDHQHRGRVSDQHHGHGHHGHAHHHHGHRSLAEIADLVDRSALSSAGKTRAKALFRRIGEAEAAIHDVPLDRVHLHEVGSTDSVIDIVGAVFALEWFGAEEVSSSPLNVGGGSVEIAHGRFPVPAPATLRLLQGVPVYSSGADAELVTPTGALIISDYARSYGPMPAMTVRAVGYGAGTKDLPGAPNVLRVVIGERDTVAPDASDVVEIECEIDDMNPQLFSPVMDRLLGAGALDVFLTPIQMKKGRPGTLLTVLVRAAERARVTDVLFRETTTIGVRFHAVARETLDREWHEVPVPGGVVRIKVAGRPGEVLNAAPEFEDCLRVATATGCPVKEVQAAAMRAWLDRESP